MMIIFPRSASNPQFVRSFNKLRSISMPTKLQPTKLSASEGKCYLVFSHKANVIPLRLAVGTFINFDNNIWK